MQVKDCIKDFLFNSGKSIAILGRTGYTNEDIYKIIRFDRDGNLILKNLWSEICVLKKENQTREFVWLEEVD